MESKFNTRGGGCCYLGFCLAWVVWGFVGLPVESPFLCHTLSPSHTFYLKGGMFAMLQRHSSKKSRSPILLSLSISSTPIYLTSQRAKKRAGHT